MEYRYNYLNEYLKEKFGERILKICIDGGFTCPNRDGKVGTGGCIFCGERGSGEHLKKDDITLQVENYLKSERSKRANKYIVYFQNFTNTYAKVEELKEKYDAALIDDRIVGIDIATRPDEINEEVVNLLKSYKNKYYIWVELGLQTANNETGRLINRGYDKLVFEKALKLLRDADIDVVTHIMVGLPNETIDDIKKTVDYLNLQDINGIKIHSTYVIKGTVLEKMYNDKKYVPITYEEYMESLFYIITHLRKSIVIHRFSGDPPKEDLVAPLWMNHKKWILNGLYKYLQDNNLYQGIYYNK